MPKFYYIARDKTGSKTSGTEEASGKEELVDRLQARDLIVINVLSQESQGPFGSPVEGQMKRKFKFRHYRVTNNDLLLFCQQLATLLSAGVTILKSLEIISQQIASRKFYNTIQKLKKDMEAGLGFHEAMEKHPAVFSELWVNLVESGEASGNLAIVLNRLAAYLQRLADFRRKLINALIYPIILMFAAVGALLFLTIRIIPTFAELFKGLNVTLPLLTRMIIALSSFVRSYIIVIIVLIITSFYIFRQYTATKEGRIRYERFKFGLPVFGEFFRALVVERFSSEMSTLVESGVPILYSLEITEHSVGNLVMSEIIHRIKEDVREGKSLNQPLEKSGFFEPMVVQMVAIGEEIGELSPMFKRLNNFYQEQVETFLTRFTSMFEPFMLIFMGIVIGLMVIGMFLPIFQLSQIGAR